MFEKTKINEKDGGTTYFIVTLVRTVVVPLVGDWCSSVGSPIVSSMRHRGINNFDCYLFLVIEDDKVGKQRSSGDSVWPDLAKFRYFDKFYAYLAIFLGFVSIWQHFESALAIFIVSIGGKNFMVVKDKYWKNDLAIWSHWVGGLTEKMLS